MGYFLFHDKHRPLCLQYVSQVRTLSTEYGYLIALLFTPLNVVLVHFYNMSKSGAKQVEGASVEAPHLDAPKGDTSPTQRMKSHGFTTPIDIGALANNFFRVSIGNPSKRGTGKPHPGHRLRGKRVGCRTTMVSLLSTARHSHGPENRQDHHLPGPHGQSLSSRDMVSTDAQI